MKYLITIVLLFTYSVLFSQDCRKALATPVLYKIGGHEFLLTPQTKYRKFQSFILESESWLGAKRFTLIKVDYQDYQGRHDILLKPLNEEHSTYLGFDNCEVDCNGRYRFKRITIYEGKRLINPESGEFICNQ